MKFFSVAARRADHTFMVKEVRHAQGDDLQHRACGSRGFPE